MSPRTAPPRPASPAVLLALALLAAPMAGRAAPAAAPAASPPPPAPAAKAPEDKGSLTFLLENDLFYDLDRHYTNGVELAWSPAVGDTPAWAGRTAARLPGFPADGAVRVAYALGQSLYTPDDITVKNPPKNAQPYAAWLHASVGLLSERNGRRDQIALSLGIVGPAALGEITQKTVHRIVGSPQPKGWDTQLDDEPAVLLLYQRSWRQARGRGRGGYFAYDFTPHLSGALGNVFTYADLGAVARFGHELPDDYGPLRIQPSLPGTGFRQGKARGTGFGWYLFGGVEGRAVIRNIFLDGNSFGDSRSVDKRTLVSELQVGLAVAWRDVSLAYTHVWRSAEFRSQDAYDEFGAISLSLRF